MALQPSSVLLRGGLDLVTPPMALPAGRAIAALNYEPEVRGYRRIGGYERFDGRPAPSQAVDAGEAAQRRASIQRVPGVGPVRGVCVYAGVLYAFRDAAEGGGAMWRSTVNGWEKVSLGFTVFFNKGSVKFTEGALLSGDTSKAFATIRRVVLQSGNWNGTAAGYLVLSSVRGVFANETVKDSQGGAGTILPAEAISIPAGGHYDFLIQNFYGAMKPQRLYGANGVGPAFEFDGVSYNPIRTGTSAGADASATPIVARDDSPIVTRAGQNVVARSESDTPAHVGHFASHLFLSFDAGSVVHSGIGEPLDFRVAAGAGEIGFGSKPTALLSSVSTSLVIFGQSRVDYLVGTDSDTFELRPITDAAGTARWSAQIAGEVPIYLDEAGLRRLSTTAAFGDWRLGTISQLVEPLFRLKRDAGVKAAASVVVKGKDQFRLFFDDGTGVILYLGRKEPEIMPIRFPAPVYCAHAGEFHEGEGERVFVGSMDGFVYELDKGGSFDGLPVPAYVRLGWNSERAPMVEKRFHSARIETDSLSDMSIGVTYDVDYSASDNLAGELRNYAVRAGSPDFVEAGSLYSSLNWGLAAAGEIRADDLAGIGRNIAITILSEHTLEEPHTLTAMTLFYAPRRQLR